MFPCETWEIFKSTFFTEHLCWLLLKLLFLFYIKIYFLIKKKRQLITLLLNQVLFSFKMKKYAGFAEMNMVLITITKAQLLPFVISCDYVWNSYLLKNCTLIKAFFFLMNRFCLPCVFFLWLFWLQRQPTTCVCFSLSVLYSNSDDGANLSES